MKKSHDTNPLLALDPEENMRMGNRFLDLKLKAEYNAETYLRGDIPADLENIFLKNALEFENSYLQSEEIQIRNILGNPSWRPEPELDDQEIELSLNQVNEMLLKHNIAVDFGGSYDIRTKYKFITEELFEEYIVQAGIPGMMMHFIYEEFHPDHKVDLEIKTGKFLSAWFDKDIDKLLWELADKIILPEGSALNKEKVKVKLQVAFNHYIHFSDCKFVIADLNFEVNDDAGMAFAEGTVSYSALTIEKEAIAVQGAFKLYFCLEYGWWDICYFVLPGFELKGKDTQNM